MLNNQQLYDKVCDSLRTHGNCYGSAYSRGWGWVNDSNPNERCAIARFIEGNTETEVIHNLKKELGMSYKDDVTKNPVVMETITLFDTYPYVLNEKQALEKALETMAFKANVEYKELDIA